MKFSYNWLKEIAHFKESPEKLVELLVLHSFEVEGMEKIHKDRVLEVKIPANRIPDAGNHRGLAREIAAITKTALKTRKAPLLNGSASGGPLAVKIESPNICQRYTGLLMKVEEIIPSPSWMRGRLEACGIRPINAVVDVTNYVMLEMGQPLHAFDADKVKGSIMTVRKARPGERVITIDGTEHALPEESLIIQDMEKIIDLAGIMGGKNSAVSEETKMIFIQGAVFAPELIYKTMRSLNFYSEAGRMYAAGVDTSKTIAGVARAAELLKSICNAKPVGKVIDLYPKKTAPLHIAFKIEHANKLIGENLMHNFYVAAFERLGFSVKKRISDMVVEIPTERRDIKIEEDLTEEAVRLYGYENIKPRFPETALFPRKVNDEFFWEEKIKDSLAAKGFAESELYEFTGDSELKQYGIRPESAIEIENPVSKETQYLVPRMLIKYANSASENLRNFDAVRIFGLGKSFVKEPKGLIRERKDLVLAYAKKGADGEREFYELKGVGDQLLEEMGISDYWYDDTAEPGTKNLEPGFFHPYRMAQIKIGDEHVGTVGEIHPEILENIKSKARIVVAEIYFEKLWRLARAEQEFRPIGKYPAVERDIAVMVPARTRVNNVQEIIENTGGELLIDSDLFDYFQDSEMLEAGQKSLAFHLVFQSSERTLKEKEVNMLIERVIRALEAQGWEVRK